jgi:hypothetical protein
MSPDLRHLFRPLIHWHGPGGAAPCGEINAHLHPQRKYVTCPECRQAAYGDELLECGCMPSFGDRCERCRADNSYSVNLDRD